MDIERVIQVSYDTGRGTRWCKLCKKPTKGKKPLCTNHMLQMPYVQGLLARIKRREEELSAAKVIDGSGIGWEILRHIRIVEVVSLKRLCRDLTMPFTIIKAYTDLFICLGLCEGYTSKRNYPGVRAL